jgi:HemK-related putative methylase
MTALDVDISARSRVLPIGASGSLWSAQPRYGIFEFQGLPVRIQVTDPEEVLFPTDCGLSLLVALNGVGAPTLAGKTVLDIGCGSGIYTVAALLTGAHHVTALDINPAAAGVTRANVLHNGLDPSRLSCVSSGLADYTPAQKFDVVITNPPHLPYDECYATANGLEAALVAGPNGRALYDTVVGRMDDLLAPGGTLLMAHSSLTDIGRTTAELEARGYQARTLEVCEMDIPLLSYAKHKQTMLGHLHRLRNSGSAEFLGERFYVHALAFSRPADSALSGNRKAL